MRRKLARLRDGQPPRVMDLFAGCGGITLGFVSAGFEPVASVELDPWAAASLGANFAKFARGPNLAALSKPRDILEEPAAIFHDLGVTGPVDAQVDVLVGGPPCQAFARVGRAKLRHEAHRRAEKDAHIAHVVDHRVNLYERYLHYVSEASSQLAKAGFAAKDEQSAESPD